MKSMHAALMAQCDQHRFLESLNTLDIISSFPRVWWNTHSCILKHQKFDMLKLKTIECLEGSVRYFIAWDGETMRSNNMSPA